MQSKVFILACLLVVAAGSAFAGTATSNMSVTATITANCTITANPLAFGAYDPIVANAVAPLNGTTTLNVVCTNGAPATVTMGQGLNPVGNNPAAPVRQMASGGNFLGYFLYQNIGPTTVWGDVGGPGEAYAGTGVATVVNVYGQIPAGQNVPAGSYSDTVIVTITF